jgi:hypothetical protein
MRGEPKFGKKYVLFFFAVPLHSTEALGGEEIWLLVMGEWSASRPGRALAQGKGHPVPIV